MNLMFVIQLDCGNDKGLIFFGVNHQSSNLNLID